MSVKDELAVLIDEAEKQGKWLFCHYQGLWFSPAQLRKLNADGRFLWGPINWSIRDPQYRVIQLELAAKCAQDALADMKEQLGHA